MLIILRKKTFILLIAIFIAVSTPIVVSALSVSYLGGTIEDIKGNLIKVNGRYYEVSKKALFKKNNESKEIVVGKSDLHVGQVVNYRYSGSQIFYIYIVR